MFLFNIFSNILFFKSKDIFTFTKTPLSASSNDHLVKIELLNGKKKFYEGSRLRFSHFDHLSLLSDITPAGQTNPISHRSFSNSYFYRTHLLWNRLPLSLREIFRPSEFRTKSSLSSFISVEETLKPPIEADINLANPKSKFFCIVTRIILR